MPAKAAVPESWRLDVKLGDKFFSLQTRNPGNFPKGKVSATTGEHRA